MSKLFNIEGKVAIVTGASSGLGRQFALALAREGAKVAILARRVEKLEGVKADIEALGVECLAAKCDVTCTESIKSTVAMLGSPITAYCASKGGVAMLTKAMANEWAQHNITVNAIGPAYFESEMIDQFVNTDAFTMAVKMYCPMGRVGKSGELDGALVYFASDASSYTTGQLLTIDGGWTTI